MQNKSIPSIREDLDPTEEERLKEYKASERQKILKSYKLRDIQYDIENGLSTAPEYELSLEELDRYCTENNDTVSRNQIFREFKRQILLLSCNEDQAQIEQWKKSYQEMLDSLNSDTQKAFKHILTNVTRNDLELVTGKSFSDLRIKLENLEKKDEELTQQYKNDDTSMQLWRCYKSMQLLNPDMPKYDWTEEDADNLHEIFASFSTSGKYNYRAYKNNFMDLYCKNLTDGFLPSNLKRDIGELNDSIEKFKPLLDDAQKRCEDPALHNARIALSQLCNIYTNHLKFNEQELKILETRTVILQAQEEYEESKKALESEFERLSLDYLTLIETEFLPLQPAQNQQPNVPPVQQEIPQWQNASSWKDLMNPSKGVCNRGSEMPSL